MTTKRTMMMTMVLLYVSSLFMSVNAIAPVPVLISIALEDIRGTYVAYEEGLLTVTVADDTITIAVKHEGEVGEVIEVTEKTYGAQFTKLQPGTLLDMTVSKGTETTYVLESLKAIHQRFSNEGATPVLIAEPVLNNQHFNEFNVLFKDEVIAMDIQPQVINDRVMVPLRFVAERLGYTVTWNGEKQSVELVQGPHYTTIQINQNRYFKNKMAPIELSSTPVIVNNRTLVPVEFITEILGFGIDFKDGQMTIYEEPFTTLTGYITEITELENYNMVYVAPRLGEDVEMWEQTVLIVSDNTIINRAPLTLGDNISGVHMPMMTMSIPGQTSAVVIY